MLKNLVTSIILTLCFTQWGFAQSSNPIEQLKVGQFQAIEDIYSALQAKFEQGMVSENELFDAYKIFYQKDDVIRPQLDEWVKRYQSPSAYLARGTFFRKLGEFRRGADYISEVPDENVTYMKQMFELSKDDLKTALRLNPKSYLAVLNLLNVAQFEGDDDAALRYLQLGNALLPSNFRVRARYLIHLTPKWGGSYELMDAFIDTCRSKGMPPAKIDMFTAIKLDDQGHSAKEQGNIEQAHSLYAKALTLSQPAGSRFRQDYLQFSLRICKDLSSSSAAYCQ